MIRPVVRVIPCNTSGIQRCKGARPSFSARANITMLVAKGSVSCLISHSPVIQAFVADANRIRAAAPA